MRFQGNGKLRGVLFVPTYPVVFQLPIYRCPVFEILQTLESVRLTNQFHIHRLIVEVLYYQRVVVIKEKTHLRRISSGIVNT